MRTNLAYASGRRRPRMTVRKREYRGVVYRIKTSGDCYYAETRGGHLSTNCWNTPEQADVEMMAFITDILSMGFYK